MNMKEQMLYSKRYPSAQQEMERIMSEGPIPTVRKSDEEFLKELWQRMDETVYKPIPERQEQGQRFIALAKELSETYEIDIDIRQKEYFRECPPRPAQP